MTGKNEVEKLSIGFNHIIDSMRELIGNTRKIFKSVSISTKSIDQIVVDQGRKIIDFLS